VYELAPRMADWFAGAASCAGHPRYVLSSLLLSSLLELSSSPPLVLLFPLIPPFEASPPRWASATSLWPSMLVHTTITHAQHTYTYTHPHNTHNTQHTQHTTHTHTLTHSHTHTGTQDMKHDCNVLARQRTSEMEKLRRRVRVNG